MDQGSQPVPNKSSSKGPQAGGHGVRCEVATVDKGLVLDPLPVIIVQIAVRHVLAARDGHEALEDVVVVRSDHDPLA